MDLLSLILLSARRPRHTYTPRTPATNATNLYYRQTPRPSLLWILRNPDGSGENTGNYVQDTNPSRETLEVCGPFLGAGGCWRIVWRHEVRLATPSCQETPSEPEDRKRNPPKYQDEDRKIDNSNLGLPSPLGASPYKPYEMTAPRSEKPGQTSEGARHVFRRSCAARPRTAAFPANQPPCPKYVFTPIDRES